jgi:hypothetical protein
MLRESSSLLTKHAPLGTRRYPSERERERDRQRARQRGSEAAGGARIAVSADSVLQKDEAGEADHLRISTYFHMCIHTFTHSESTK